MRIPTADCPLVDPGLVDAVVQTLCDGDLDFVRTSLRFPDGFDVEAFTASALDQADELRDVSRSDREHVTPYLAAVQPRFTRVLLEPDADRSSFRVTLDEPEDLQVIGAVFEHFAGTKFDYEEVADLMDERPALRAIIAPRRRGRAALDGREALAACKAGDPRRQHAAVEATRDVPPERLARLLLARRRLHRVGPRRHAVHGHGAHGHRHEHPRLRRSSGRRGGQPHDQRGRYEHAQLPGRGAARRASRRPPPLGRHGTVRRGPGGEACAIAVRIARAASGRSGVAICGYHGWSDWYLRGQPRRRRRARRPPPPGPRAQGCAPAPHRIGTAFRLQRPRESRTGAVGGRRGSGVHGGHPDLPRGGLPRGRPAPRDRALGGARVRRVHVGVPSSARRHPPRLRGRPRRGRLRQDPRERLRDDRGHRATRVMDIAQETFISSTFWTERIGPTAALAVLDRMAETDACAADRRDRASRRRTSGSASAPRPVSR